MDDKKSIKFLKIEKNTLHNITIHALVQVCTLYQTSHHHHPFISRSLKASQKKNFTIFPEFLLLIITHIKVACLPQKDIHKVIKQVNIV